jgi:hypothetical protein
MDYKLHNSETHVNCVHGTRSRLRIWLLLSWSGNSLLCFACFCPELNKPTTRSVYYLCEIHFNNIHTSSCRIFRWLIIFYRCCRTESNYIFNNAVLLTNWWYWSPRETEADLRIYKKFQDEEKVKLLSYPMLPDFQGSIAFGTFPGIARLSFW